MEDSRLSSSTAKSTSFIYRIFAAWRSTNERRAIFGCVIGGLSLLTLGNLVAQRGSKKRRRKAREATAAAAKDATSAAPRREGRLKHVLRLSASPSSAPALRWGAFLSASVIAKLLVGTQVNAEIGKMGGLLVAREWDALYLEQGIFLLWCIPYSILKGLTTWSRQRLALCLRRGLSTKLNDDYLAVNITATLRELRDPDARLTSDVERLTTTCAETLEQWVASATDIVVKNGQLASRMGVAPLGRFYASMIGVVAWMRLATPSTKDLILDEREAEGVLISQHAAVRAHAEEIDLLRGGEPEREMLAASLARVDAIIATRANTQLRSDVLRSFVTRHISVFLGLSAMIPAVYDSALAANGDAGVAHVTEYFLSALHMMVDVAMGVGKFFKSLGPLNEAGALAERIAALSDVVNSARDEGEAAATGQSGGGALAEGAALTCDRLCIALPGSACTAEAIAVAPLLVRDLSFTLRTEGRLLIVGPNGSGKTSLLRVLAGLWPAQSGSVAMPPRDDCFFVPSRPYLLPASSSATLRAQLAYPLSGQSADDNEEGILAVLREVHLLAALERGAPGSVLDQPIRYESERTHRTSLSLQCYRCVFPSPFSPSLAFAPRPVRSRSRRESGKSLGSRGSCSGQTASALRGNRSSRCSTRRSPTWTRTPSRRSLHQTARFSRAALPAWRSSPSHTARCFANTTPLSSRSRAPPRADASTLRSCRCILREKSEIIGLLLLE